MTASSRQDRATDRSEGGFGAIQYFVVGGAGIAIAAIALSEAVLPLPKVSSSEFKLEPQSVAPRQVSRLDRDYQPPAENVARVHQSQIAVAFDTPRPARMRPAPASAQVSPSQTSDIAAFTALERPLPAPLIAVPAAGAQQVETASVAQLPVLELSEDFELERLAAIAAMQPPAAQAESAPAATNSLAVVSPPESPGLLAANEPASAPDFGVMELTAEYELDESLLAAIEPAEVDFAEAAPAAAPAIAAAEEIAPAAPATAYSPPVAPAREMLSADLRAFDLAKVDAPAQPSALSQVIELQKQVVANGMALGTVDIRISGNSTIEVRLGSILSLLQDQMEPELYERLSTANSAGTYVTFADLRAAGIRINFDPVRDMLTMSADAS